MAEAVAERETPLSPARRSHPHLEAVENLPQSARQTGLEAAGMNDYFLAVDPEPESSPFFPDLTLRNPSAA